MQPAVGEGFRRRFRLVPIAGRDVGSLDQKLADVALHHVTALVVDDADGRVHQRLAGRTDLANGVGGVEHGAGRAGLGHAPALDQGHAPGAPTLENGKRAGRTADAGDSQSREIRALELGMLHHELVRRRHREEVRDAERWIRDAVERCPWIEGAHDQDGASGMQHGIGVAVQPAGMEQRQDHELHRLRGDQGGNAEVHAVPEVHPVRDDGALRVARRARGVNDHGDVVVIERGRRGSLRRSGKRLLVGAVGAIMVDLEQRR